jgi:hypothetical protein
MHHEYFEPALQFTLLAAPKLSTSSATLSGSMSCHFRSQISAAVVKHHRLLDTPEL